MEQKSDKIFKKEIYQKSKHKYIEYLKYWDEECKTNAEQLLKEETPMLTVIYEDLAQNLIRESKLAKIASESQAVITDELNNLLTKDEQKRLLQWQELENTIYEEREQQLFVYGYVISSLMRIESKRKYKTNKYRNMRRKQYNGKRRKGYKKI